MEFGLATDQDEPHLRALLRAEPMPGWVRLSYEREPNFFHAAATQGNLQTIVARRGGQIAGMGCRAWRQVYLNGIPTDIGYLSGLRSLPSARRGSGLARGYAFLKSLHGDGKVPGYLSTIIEENTAAHGLLTSQRAGLPSYYDLGRFLTFAIPRGRCKPARVERAEIPVEVARSADRQEVVTFLNEQGCRRQFFPVVQVEDLDAPLWRGLGDFLVARQADGSIAGVLAGWDQSAFKQVRVAGYGGWLAVSRWACNLGLRLAGLPRLPAPGSPLRLLNVALVCVREDRADTFGTLLNTLHARLKGSSVDFICCGFHERDPLLAALRPSLSLRYTSRAYWVSWEERNEALARFDSRRIPYLETGTL